MFELVVNAAETEIFVLLIILLTVLIIPFTAIFEPTVSMVSVLAILNLVFVPVTYIEEAVVLTVPETALVFTVETLTLVDRFAVLFKSAKLINPAGCNKSFSNFLYFLNSVTEDVTYE